MLNCPDRNKIFFIFVPLSDPKGSSVESANGMFKLQWTYNNGKLTFNMTCKTTGWCAVGFTTTGDGRNMVNYDIAVGGVTSNTGYLDVSLSGLCI